MNLYAAKTTTIKKCEERGYDAMLLIHHHSIPEVWEVCSESYGFSYGTWFDYESALNVFNDRCTATYGKETHVH